MMTKQPTTSTTTPTIVVATVEAVEAVRNVVSPARDARLTKEAVNLQVGVISSPLGRSSDGDDAARLGHSEVSEALSQEVTPADDQSPSKKRKKKSKRAKTKSGAKYQNLESSSTLGRSSDGNDAARLGHAEVSEALSQEVTPADKQSPSKKRKKNKKKAKRFEKKNKAKNQDLMSGRRSHEDDVPKRRHSEVSKAPVQELAPVKERPSSVQHHENLNTTSLPDKKTKEKDRQRSKVFKKIEEFLKRFGKKLSKKLEKKIIKSLAGVAISVIGMLGINTIISNNPMEQQGQTQVIYNMYCSVSESASPVAVTPNQSVSKTGNTHMQVNQACYVAQQ